MEEIYKNLSLENLENEIWRDVVGYEGKYQVSSYGRVKSIRDGYGNYREKILKQAKMKNGYLYVQICKEGKIKTCRVHRLVANAFIPNTNNYPTVNHINENKTDNRVCNLEWMDYSQQQRHGTCIQRRVEKERNGVLSKQVYQYDNNHNLIKIWQSTREVGRNGYNQGAVAACCNGDRKQHRGYIWSYYPL